jgi:hypothetical protein
VSAGDEASLRKEAGDAAVVVGGRAMEELPRSVSIAALQRHANAGGGAA